MATAVIFKPNAGSFAQFVDQEATAARMTEEDAINHNQFTHECPIT